VLVQVDQVVITRSDDRFVVPPSTKIFSGGRLLVVLRVRNGHGDMREYEMLAVRAAAPL